MTTNKVTTLQAHRVANLIALAVAGIRDCDDSRFWDAVQPLLTVAGITEDQVRDAWNHATPDEGYANTLALLGVPHMLTIYACRAAGDAVQAT